MAATTSTEPSVLPSEARKVVIVGSAGSGKTSLVSRFASNTYTDDYFQTFGSDLLVKHVASSAHKRTMDIWCCGGHERYRALLEQFYVDAHVSTPSRSDVDLMFWYNEVQRVCPEAIIMLIGTKADEADNIRVNSQDAVKQATEWGVVFRSVSAKSDTGVTELFTELVDLLAQ